MDKTIIWNDSSPKSEWEITTIFIKEIIHSFINSNIHNIISVIMVDTKFSHTIFIETQIIQIDTRSRTTIQTVEFS